MKMTTRIAFDNMKYHKSRNILTGIAIFLATLLLFVVPTVGFDIISAQYAMVNECYPTWQALYRNVGSDTVQKLSAHHDIVNYGLRSDAGMWIVNDKCGYLLYLDNAGLEMYRMNLTEGNLPVKENEVVISQGILKALGQENAKVGDRIVLPYQIERNGGLDYVQEQEFVISGFLEETEDQENFNPLVSEEFLKQEIPKEQITYRFLLQVADMKYSNTDKIEKNIRDIAAQFDIPEDNIAVNTEIINANYVDPAFLLGIVIICIIIMLAGIVTIYSIYYVSIPQRIQEFGKIKAIGATRKQIRQILLREGILVAVCAIPIGLLCGSLLVKLVLVKMVSMYGETNITLEVTKRIIMNNEIVLYPWWMYPVVILTLLFTVYVSLIKPIRKVAKISAVEAMRYQEKENKHSKRKGYEYLTIGRLTCNSILGNKKKSLITILSMSFTGIFLMVIATVLACADPSNSADNTLVGQYVITQNVEYGNKEHPEREWLQIQKDNPLNDNLLEQLSVLQGVNRVDAFSEIDISGDIFEDGYGEDICGVPEEYADEIERGIVEGNAAYEDLKSGDNVIVDKNLLRYFPSIKVGDKLHITVHDGTKDYDKELNVIAIGDYRFGLTNYNYLIMAKEAADSLSSYNVNRYYSVIADKNYDSKLEQEINTVISSSQLLELETWQEQYENWKSAITLTRSGCYAFLLVLSAICIMNLINSMINSVHVRKKELGMMQAIGMSDRQLHKMLQMEGAFYTFGTLLVSVGIGSLAGYPVFIWAKGNGMFNIREYHYPYGVAMIIVVVLVIVQMVLVYALGKSLKKESLIDRIRFSE